MTWAAVVGFFKALPEMVSLIGEAVTAIKQLRAEMALANSYKKINTAINKARFKDGSTEDIDDLVNNLF